MNLNTLPSKELMPGYHGKMVHGNQLTWAFWTVEKGAVVPEHQHPHEQIMHVVEGDFEFTLDGKQKFVNREILCTSHQIFPTQEKRLLHVN